MNVAYAFSGSAIAGVVALAVYHELPPLRPEPAAAALNETVVVKTNPEPPASHPVRTVPISPAAVSIFAPSVDHPFDPLAAHPVAKPRAAPKPREAGAGDVCARHGGHRVDDPARRRWHCVFSKRSAR